MKLREWICNHNWKGAFFDHKDTEYVYAYCTKCLKTNEPEVAFPDELR